MDWEPEGDGSQGDSEIDELEEAELQRAIAMSMMEVQPGEGQGAAPQPPGGLPQQPAGGATSAAALQQALQQALLQMAAATQQPAHQPQQPAAPAPRPAPEPPAPPPPAWVAAATQWAPAQSATAPASALLPGTPANWEAALAASLSKALGLPVAVMGGGSSGGDALAAGAVPVMLAAEGSGMRLGAAVLDAALGRAPLGGGAALAMQAIWLRAAEALAQPAATEQPAVGEALRLLQARAVKKAVGVLESDEDDLYFEGGRHRRAFGAALEAGQVASTFLEALAASATTPAEAKLWEEMLREAFTTMRGFDFTAADKHAGALRRLDVLTQCPTLRRALAALLLREAAAATARRGAAGKALEDASILAPLLAVSPLPTLARRRPGLDFPAAACFMQLRGYPGNRGGVGPELSSIRRALAGVYTAAHEVAKRVATLKVADGALKGREAWLAWLAAAAGANLARAEAGATDALLRDARFLHHSSSDGFMVGALAAALRFCRPFMRDAGEKRKALAHLDPSYYTTQAHRLPGLERERSLAGSMLPPPTTTTTACPYLVSDSPSAVPPHFVAETFFLTQRLIHVGLMPTVYKAGALAKMLRRQAGGDEDEEEEEEDEPSAGGATLESWLLADSVGAQLMDPDLANDAVQFMGLTAMWLLGLLRSGPEAALAAFERVPESVLVDLTSWLSYVIRARGTELLGGLDIGLLMDCLTGLLRRTELVPSPKLHYGIVSLLLSMLSPQLYGRQRPGAHALAGAHMSPAESALVSGVLRWGSTSGAELLPAVMAAYSNADHVVALDVDKDTYDKFTMRHCIDLLLMEIWKDPDCFRALGRVAAAAGADELFPEFVGAVLNDLMYLLKDSLGRLEDIHALEGSMADTAGWAALSPREREDKRAFYQAQQRAAGGFMYQAVSTLRMLNKLTEHPDVQRSFLAAPIAGRAANACVHFLDLLVGPRCASLAVAHPERYWFDPDNLLLDTATLLLRLAEHPAFVKAVSDVPDYEETVMRAVHDALAAKQLGEYEHRRRLEALIAAVRGLRGGAAGPAADEPAEAAGPLDLALPAKEPPAVEEEYAAAMEELTVGDFDSAAPRAYNRAYAKMAEQASGDATGKMKALAKEMRALRGRTRLPIHAAASIFVRHDSDRLEKVRALVTGPEGTPYYGGCFFFDVYFPQDYPNVPPLMEIETTGGGVARFNPNLYADGKVCLSLLGTWHGADESEKWQPASSSLFQILLSIQGLIFIADPYFNEPGLDDIRGKAEGNSASFKYNAEIWLNNIRYAMLDVLRHPRPGFEDVIATHFRLLRHRILRQCAEWVRQAERLDVQTQRRLRHAVQELHGELARLG